ncbi:MAG: dihydroorotase, partial [Planctomycetes bacterium]|nr:dihydroorotase [Planctomycetota bacterium]
LTAPPGIVGLETAVALAARAMVQSKRAQWPQLIAWLTSGPVAVLGLDPRPIEVGATANLALIDPNAQWTVEPGRFQSKGRNTPFAGWTLDSRPLGTIRGRRWTHAGDPPPAR